MNLSAVGARQHCCVCHGGAPLGDERACHELCSGMYCASCFEKFTNLLGKHERNEILAVLGWLTWKPVPAPVCQTCGGPMPKRGVGIRGRQPKYCCTGCSLLGYRLREKARKAAN